MPRRCIRPGRCVAGGTESDATRAGLPYVDGNQRPLAPPILCQCSRCTMPQNSRSVCFASRQRVFIRRNGSQSARKGQSMPINAGEQTEQQQ